MGMDTDSIQQMLGNAARSGNLSVLDQALDLGADPNMPDPYWSGMNPIMMAMGHGQSACVERMASRIDPKARCDVGYDALMHAAMSGDAHFVELALRKCDPLASNPKGWTALLLAAHAGNEEGYAKLASISSGCAVGMGTPDGGSEGSFDVLGAGIFGLPEALCLDAWEKGWGNPDRESSGNVTSLMRAVARDHAELVSRMARSSNQALADEAGDSALMWAIKKGSLSMSQSLVAAGADLAGCNEEGWTPLMVALGASGTKGEIAKLLIDSGAEVRNPKMMEGGGSAPDLQGVKLNAGARGMNALMIAVWQGSISMAEMLAPISDIEERDVLGRTALMLCALCPMKRAAARTGAMAKFLLDSGADSGALDAKGKSAVDHAVQSGSMGALEVLLSSAMYVKNQEAWEKALDSARAAGREEVAAWLAAGVEKLSLEKSAPHAQGVGGRLPRL